jgi:putative tricarboxylic transport membrane protein
MITDRLFGATVALLALVFVTMAVPAIELEGMASSDVGYYTMSPRMFPYATGGLCLLFGALVALRPERRDLLRNLRTLTARRSVFTMVILMIIYVAALDFLGFVLASMLALAAFFVRFGERRWVLIAVLSIGVPMIIKFVFARFCLLELPVGPLRWPF